MEGGITLQLDKRSRKPLYEQVVYGIKQDIMLGILEVNEKLPSVRELASQLLINPNTISKAYKQLESEGIIMTIRGKGTFVAEQVNTARDERKVQAIKEKLIELVVEANYQQVGEGELLAWIKEAVKSNGGMKNES
ncbi:GntR family transcriptional regulator [Vagococcus xieshaowenii]|uniref:GntR family transcriptional regulator n=1 Tax=Vagococcus xieshaowenii TaxID=2562451 RepID=A0AAJ5EFC2_9ENTE|nr:GntR family transcriptional regulator [Vagococcus xieshaowenii]TFZ40569.1 GntR family transcriptional regulator [Vagococcus xieshaowenii]